TIGLTFLFVFFLVAFIPKTTIDTSASAVLRATDPVRIAYDEFRDEFDQTNFVVIAISSKDIFNINFLSQLKSFHENLNDNIPYVKKITSLINARDTYSKNDELVVGELLEEWPENEDDLALLKNRVDSNPLFLNSIISKDGRVTAVVIEIEAIIDEAGTNEDLIAEFEEDESVKSTPTRYFKEKDNQEVIKAVNEIVKEYNTSEFSIAFAGDLVVLDVYNRAMERDIVMVVVLSLIMIGIFLSILFQRFSGVLLPEIIIVSGLFSTLGLLSMFKISIKLTTIVLPGFLLAVCVGYAVHILSIFYVQYQKGSNKEDAIAYAMGHSGLAVVLTAITTAASLFSFAFSELLSIADLGIFGATGVLLAFVYTMLLVPSFIALLPIKRKKESKQLKKSALMDKILMSIANFSMHHPQKVVVGSLILFAVAIYYTFQISYSHNILNWIPKDKKIQHDVQYIDTHLKGAANIEVVLNTNNDDGVKDPVFLNKIQTTIQKLYKYNKNGIMVGKVFSINDVIMEINQSMFDNDPKFYHLPATKAAVSQELLLFENAGSNDLESLTDKNYQKTRISIKIPWTDAVYLKDFLDHVQSLFYQEFQDSAQISVTGGPTLLARSVPAALLSMSKSYVIAFVVITFLMIFHTGSIKIGLLSMISNLLPIFMTMGIMGFLQIKLDMSTIMIGSIAIGIVVDDTLHFMYNFRKYYELTKDASHAIRETMLGTGRALFLTSIILCSGFFILMTASLSLLVVFGALTGLTIIFALLADFILNPALMILVTRRKKPIEAAITRIQGEI
ncbi:MAG: MMPL family transporter, partial [Desulfobacula sp.]|nr:MMPL family transporter [Desulfobacula sp.]